MASTESNMYWLGYLQTHKSELSMLVRNLGKLKTALDKGFEPNVSPQAIKKDIELGCFVKMLKLDSDLMYFLYIN